MELTKQQLRKLRDALLAAFDSDAFEEMLLLGLKKDLEAIVEKKALKSMILDVIRLSERQGWTMNLVAAARAENPGNAKLMLIADELGLTPELAYTEGDGEGTTTVESPKKSALQRMIDGSNSQLDIAVWRENLGKVETQTCSIEIGTKHQGTGFLLGPSVIMTNYHVMKPVIDGDASPTDVRIRFDFKRTEGGSVISSGTLFELESDDEWLIDHSQYSDADLQGVEENDSKPDELDYALLRVADEPGASPLGGNLNAEPRGWIEVPSTPHEFVEKQALFIVQHPDGKPMKLAIDSNAITGVNEKGTRVRYRTNTEHGSSGSPCFDQEWNLVALHHSGDLEVVPNWNQGIPFSKIVALLEERGLADAIGEEGEE